MWLQFVTWEDFKKKKRKKKIFYKLVYENCQLLILEMIWYRVSLQYNNKKKI